MSDQTGVEPFSSANGLVIPAGHIGSMSERPTPLRYAFVMGLVLWPTAIFA